jgi:hypothetical protein
VTDRDKFDIVAEANGYGGVPNLDHRSKLVNHQMAAIFLSVQRP